LRNLRSGLSAAIVSMVFAMPAYAQGGTVVPEPNSIAVLSLAMAGVLIGRRMAKGNPPQD